MILPKGNGTRSTMLANLYRRDLADNRTVVYFLQMGQN